MAFGQKSADLLGNMPWASLTPSVIPSEVGPLERCIGNCFMDVD
jgi:hypothetical protein